MFLEVIIVFVTVIARYSVFCSWEGEKVVDGVVREELPQLVKAPDLSAIKETLDRYSYPTEEASLDVKYQHERNVYLNLLQRVSSYVLNDQPVAISFATAVTSNLFSEPPTRRLWDHINWNVFPMSVIILDVLDGYKCDSQLFMEFSNAHFVDTLVKSATGTLLPVSAQLFWIVKVTIDQLVGEKESDKLAEYTQNITNGWHYMEEMLLTREHSEHIVKAVEIFKTAMVHASPHDLAIQANEIILILSKSCKNEKIVKDLLHEIVATVDKRVGKIEPLQRLIKSIEAHEKEKDFIKGQIMNTQDVMRKIEIEPDDDDDGADTIINFDGQK